MNFLKTLGCLSQSLLILFVGLSLSNAYAAPPAKAFGELPVSLDADISPDGQRIAVILNNNGEYGVYTCLLYTSPSPRDQRGSRMPSSA